MKRSAVVTGAGIVGLATAHALAVKGYQVTVVERTAKAIGASIRNFGMIWPVGQPDGALYERAMLSRSIWQDVCVEAGIWHDEVGSLHVAYEHDEWDVLTELEERFAHRGYQLLTPGETKRKSPFVNEKNLRGSLYSKDEMIVDPREAISTLPSFLTEKYGVDFIWGKAVTGIRCPSVHMGKEVIEADDIYVCSGADFETLYPEMYKDLSVTKCKLQMMRLQAKEQRIGPALCGGLSLIHYNAFKAADSLESLRTRYEAELPEYIKWGVHVMVCQNQYGELTVGDSHEYGDTHDPFDRNDINELILRYLGRFASFPDIRIIETWNGLYAKHTNGGTEMVAHPEQGVTVINALGGAGMTLSFGLCEQVVNEKYNTQFIVR